MDRESIVADLRKLSSKISAKKITEVCVEVDICKNVQFMHEKTQDLEKDITIEFIVDKVKPPFVAVKDAGGYIHDNVTLAVKCSSGHLHKYYVDTIMKYGLSQELECHTCGAGNKFQRLVRQTTEKLLEMPFIIKDVLPILNSKSRTLTLTYTNPVLKLDLNCSHSSSADSGEESGDGYYTICFHTTLSVKRINDTLRKYLSKNPILCRLNDKQKMQIETKKSKKREKDPIPISPALAEMNSTMGAKTPDNRIDNSDKLYIENCTI